MGGRMTVLDPTGSERFTRRGSPTSLRTAPVRQGSFSVSDVLPAVVVRQDGCPDELPSPAPRTTRPAQLSCVLSQS